MSDHKTLSAPYELMPPEYKRNELGQFDRPGKTLAKTAKKTGLNKQRVEKSERNANGQLQKGHSLPGPGRPKGSLNKTTLQLREMILLALDKLGGPDYLVALGRENSSAYASLLSKVLPTTLSAPNSDGGVGVELRFIREVVWPSGHREVEGATPKALPAPDASRPTDPTDDTNEGAV